MPGGAAEMIEIEFRLSLQKAPTGSKSDFHSCYCSVDGSFECIHELLFFFCVRWGGKGTRQNYVKEAM